MTVNEKVICSSERKPLSGSLIAVSAPLGSAAF